MITTNREMINQVYYELERRLQNEWIDTENSADCDGAVLTIDDYDNLRTWLIGALQGIYSVFYSQASNWSDTVTFMRETEQASSIIRYFTERRYKVIFDE